MDFSAHSLHLSMINFEKRLDSLKNWSYRDDVPCSALNLAKTGFYCPDPVNNPDSTKCFCCCKELEGWEEDDDPSKEHRSHSVGCTFLKFQEKDWKSLSLKEYIVLKTSISKNYRLYI